MNERTKRFVFYLVYLGLVMIATTSAVIASTNCITHEGKRVQCDHCDCRIEERDPRNPIKCGTCGHWQKTDAIEYLDQKIEEAELDSNSK